MNESNARPRQLRFSVFEVDLRTGELRKQGLKVKLHGQPFQILAMLLERPGELVTREEIREKLWPGDTFIDFEHSVNSSIKRLREALGDDPAAPRFIETLPRHGYRFIAPVEPHHPLTPSSERRGANADSPPASGGGQGVVAVGAIHESPLRRHWVAAVAGGFVAAVVAVLLALNAAGLGDRLLTALGARRAVPAPRIESIAVLPLENLSRDPEQEYFADGMTEELITNLGKISALRVISRTSVMQYKGTKKPLPQIARELNVDAVVEGTVQRSGDRVRITANLLHASTDRHLWAETYERDLRDVLTLQSEVARAIADEIKARVQPQEQARLATARPVNPEAHRLYLLGRFYWNKRTEEGLKNALDHFQRAVETDPTYAPAYAGLADSYLQLANSGFRPPNEFMPRAKAVAQKALDIDESLGEAHTTLAEAHKDYDWDWPACEKEFKRAIELNPNYATAHMWYAEYLSLTRRHAEAIAEAQRAQQLDPLSPVIRVVLAIYGGYFYARQYDEAIRTLRDAVSLFPEYPQPYWCLVAVYEAKGMYQEAIAAYQKAESLSGASPAEVAALGQAYAKGGMRGYYLWKIEKLREKSKHDYVRPVDLAYLYAGLGEKDQAFSYLENAYQDRDWMLNLLQIEPAFDPLRSDSRFQDLLRRMNFPR
jgi:TolB-like protein/DNA-binding winged helix-turn-helix (wHTH) protein/Tfp pilus assembly protein PilF